MIVQYLTKYVICDWLNDARKGNHLGMKKMIAFLLLCGTCFGFYAACKINGANEFHSLATAAAKSVCFVTNVQADIQDENVKIVPSGNQYYIYMPIRLQEKYSSLAGICGYVYYYPPSVPVDALQAELMQFASSYQNIGKTRVVTGYTNRFADFCFVNGKKVNIQLAVTEGAVIVGYPMILTGF